MRDPVLRMIAVGERAETLAARWCAREGYFVPGSAVVILDLLLDREPRTVGELSAEGPPTNAVYVVRRMAEHGLVIVEKPQRDRRRTLVRLTPRGRELAQRARRWAAGEAVEELARLLPREMGVWLRGMARVRTVE